MKSYREELTFETKTRRSYLNITPQVEAALQKSGVKEGLCLVNPMHISASSPCSINRPHVCFGQTRTPWENGQCRGVAILPSWESCRISNKLLKESGPDRSGPDSF